MASIIQFNPKELTNFLSNTQELKGIIEKIEILGVTGHDFLYMSPDAFLCSLGVTPTLEQIAAITNLKNQLQQPQPAKITCEIGCITQKLDKTVVLCCPLHQPQVFECHLLLTQFQYVDNASLEANNICEIIMQDNIIKCIVVHPEGYKPPVISSYMQVLQNTENDKNESPSLALDDQPQNQQQQQLSPTSPSIPFNNANDDLFAIAPLAQTPDKPRSRAGSQSGFQFMKEAAPFHSQPINTQLQVESPPKGQTKLKLQEAASQPVNTKLLNCPYITKIKLIGRIDFLIDTVGFICVPKSLSLNLLNAQTFNQQQIDSLRDFDISKDLGLIAAFNLQLCNAQCIRGDIVEFDLVPGYSYSSVGVIHSGYPLTCEKVKSKVPEFEEFLRMHSNNDQLTPCADGIKLLSRIEKQVVSKQYLIHGNFYNGVVYTFYEPESYGFIKSYGNLKGAKSYSQGFEVYFKIQSQQKQSYTPQRGDIVTFKSHWVEDKAQAREIKLVARLEPNIMKGTCVALCPPYAMFMCSHEELQQNLFFQKTKQITFQLKIGQPINFKFDPDISSHFRASELQVEMQVSKSQLQLSSSPTKQQLVSLKQMFWEAQFMFCRLTPFFMHVKILKPTKVGKIIKFDVVSKTPLTLNKLNFEIKPQEVFKPLVSSGQYLALVSQCTKHYAIELGQKYVVQLIGVSEEYMFFGVGNVYFAVPRQNTPYYIVYEKSIRIIVNLEQQDQLDCLQVGEGWAAIVNNADFATE